MGVAARTSPNSTFYCGLQWIFPLHVCIGGFVIFCGLLILILGILAACKGQFSNNVRVRAIIVSIVVVVLFVWWLGSLSVGVIVATAAGDVFRSFSSISADQCNLVMYYWAFADIVIVLVLYVTVWPISVIACIFCSVVALCK